MAQQKGPREMLNHLSERVSTPKTIFLLDHFEGYARIESFVRTEFVPSLPNTGILVVIASRAALPIKWRTEPSMMARIERIILGHLTWEQSQELMIRAGIDDGDQRNVIARQTGGYPLALALAVRTVAQNKSPSSVELHEISAALFQEVTPQLYEYVETLAFLRTATQDVLEDALQPKVITLDDFTALGHLSFVRVTDQGLAVNDVARSYFINELKLRNPRRFDELLSRVVHVSNQIWQKTGAATPPEVIQNLVTLCMFAGSGLVFPDPSVSPEISYKALPTCDVAMQKDGPELHNLIESGIVVGAGSRGIDDYHGMADLTMTHFPDSIQVARSETGRPIAFATFLPLCAESLAVLPKYIGDLLRDSMGTDLLRYHGITQMETDTVLSLLSCVAETPERHTFMDSLLALKITGWTQLAHGKRCILFNAVDTVDTFYAQLGYTRLLSRDTNPYHLGLYDLDFRSQSMNEWLVRLLFGFKSQKTKGNLSIHLLREALNHIRRPELLAGSELTQILDNMPSEQLHKRLREVLTESPPPAPLTPLLQGVLRKTYVEQKRKVTMISKELNIGRTTYYRYLDEALAKLLSIVHHW